MAATKVKYGQTEDNLVSNSMARQAIINGNFDVWQRGTSVDTGYKYTADRWQAIRGGGAAGGTASRQTASLDGSKYSCRVQRNSGTSETDYIRICQNLESVDSMKFQNKSVTLSFWAKKGADFTDSVIGVGIRSGTGTDESFITGYTGSVSVAASTPTLTTSWQKFTLTGAVPSNSNELAVYFTYNDPSGTASTNDWFEVTQVQLCAGDVALPFMPKSFEEEYRTCMRYYEKGYAYATAPGTAVYSGSNGFNSALGNPLFYYNTAAAGTLRKWAWKNFVVPKRATPTIRYWDGAGTLSRFTLNNTDGTRTADGANEQYQGAGATDEKQFYAQTAAETSGWTIYWDAASEL